MKEVEKCSKQWFIIITIYDRLSLTWPSSTTRVWYLICSEWASSHLPRAIAQQPERSTYTYLFYQTHVFKRRNICIIRIGYRTSYVAALCEYRMHLVIYDKYTYK